MQWFIYSGGQQSGPHAWETLVEWVRDGRLSPTDYIWNADMGEQWAEARTVPGLFAPPPISPSSPTPAPVVTTTSITAAYNSGPRVRPSCTAAVAPAWARMKALLFRPFQFGLWFVLGFSAWLATLGEYGGSFGGGADHTAAEKWAEGGFSRTELESTLHAVTQTLQEHRTLITALVAGVVLLALLVGAALLWVRARGKFMFLDNLVNCRAEVGLPWRTYREHAASFFWWTLGYALICLLLSMGLLALGFFSILRPWWIEQSISGLWPVIVANGALWFAMAVVAGYIARYLEDFVIPLMYNNDLTATEAWGRFLGLFGEHTGALIVYGLFYGLVLHLLVGLAILAVVLVTCCVAGCVLMIPYLGTVLLLPALVFLRYYSLEYLAQFGDAYHTRPDSNDA